MTAKTPYNEKRAAVTEVQLMRDDLPLPFILYQNLTQEAVVLGCSGEISRALSFCFLGEDDSAYT